MTDPAAVVQAPYEAADRRDIPAAPDMWPQMRNGWSQKRRDTHARDAYRTEAGCRKVFGTVRRDWQEFTLVPGRLLRRRRDGDRPGHGATVAKAAGRADGWLWGLRLCTCSRSRMDGSSGRPTITTPHCGCWRSALDSCAGTAGGQRPTRRDDAAGSRRGGRQGGVRGVVTPARPDACPPAPCHLASRPLSPICAACHPRNSAASVAPARTTAT